MYTKFQKTKRGSDLITFKMNDSRKEVLFILTLEIPASQIFLGANTQLLGTSLAGAKMP